MPTYEYTCDNCGYTFEQFQKMSDQPLKKCPQCDGTVRRLFSKGVGIIFKRARMYASDYENNVSSGKTCCGRTERCEKPPCSDDGVCKR